MLNTTSGQPTTFPDFASIYRHGFARVAACVNLSHVADPQSNAQAIINAAEECHAQAAAVAVFPELCLS
ncbi:MAG TPA: hypothetical protein VGN98_15120, partial [Tianweitania sediminis]|nr:hypothetical protein [Tianweitania sediminis]